MVYPAHLFRIPTVREDRPAYGCEPEGGGSRPERSGGAPAPDGRSVEVDVPAPPTDSAERKAELDAIEELGDEIATLAAHIHAATHRLLVLIADFDRRRGWELSGHRTCAHWLSFRTGINLGAAREKVRAARALTELPETSAAMSRGELSFSKVRALTRVADAENESELLELARGCTTAQLERVMRAWKRGDREDEAARERERYERRRLSIFPDDDGMYVVRGKLTPELGALLMRAVEAASDALYQADRAAERSSRQASDRLSGQVPERSSRQASARSDGQTSGCGPASGCGREPQRDSRRAARQRRADALGLLAESAMSVGFGGPDGGDAPVSGTRAERYQVMLHVDAATLDAEAEPGRSELEDGTRVSAETSRRLACDSGLVRIARAPDGSLLDVGRRTRTIPPALRRALEVRDRGCRFPGCGLRFTDAHHVRHWADGGETSLANCLLLCRHHHRLVHEDGWRVEWWGDGRPVFFDPRGGTHFDGRWRPGGSDEKRPEARSGFLPTRGHATVAGGDPADGRDGDPVDPTDPTVAVSPPDHVSAETGVRDEKPAATDILDTLKRDNRSCSPDWQTASARWRRLEDVPDEVLHRALEALS